MATNRNEENSINHLKCNDLSYLHSLLINGFDCNAVISGMGASLFHLVVGDESPNYSMAATKLCLMFGGDPNLRSSDGFTPMHVCSAWGRTNILKILLRHGGDPSIKDDYGLDACAYALKEGHMEVLNIISKFKDQDDSEMLTYGTVNKHDLVNEWCEKYLTGHAELDNEMYENTVDQSSNESAVQKLDNPEYCSYELSSNSLTNEYLSCHSHIDSVKERAIEIKMPKSKKMVVSGIETLYSNLETLGIENDSIHSDNDSVLHADSFLTYDISIITADDIKKSESDIMVATNTEPELTEVENDIESPENNKLFGNVTLRRIYSRHEQEAECSYLQNEFEKKFDEEMSFRYENCKAEKFNSSCCETMLLPNQYFENHEIDLDNPSSSLTSSFTSASDQSQDIFNNIIRSISPTSISPISETKNTNDTTELINTSNISHTPASTHYYSSSENSQVDISNPPENERKEDHNIQMGDMKSLEMNKIEDLDTSECVESSEIYNWMEQSTQLISKASENTFSKSNSCKPNSKSILTQKCSSDESYIAVAEEKKFLVDDLGVELVERLYLVTPCEKQTDTDETLSNASTNFSIPKSVDYDTDSLRQELKALGINPGPITSTTKKVYIKRLLKIKRHPDKHIENVEKKVYSNELNKTLKDTNWVTDLKKFITLEDKVTQQFSCVDSNKIWRGGNQKTSFTYLLLDPRITNNLPARVNISNVTDTWGTFIDSVFYVGKGVRSRPYAHLYQAVEFWNKTREDKKHINDKKVKRILDIWTAGSGVVCLNVFQHVIPAEAFTREAAMIDALSLINLTNMKSGEYYGIATGWSCREKRNFGVYLLYRAMNIFLNEGERQIHPADLK